MRSLNIAVAVATACLWPTAGFTDDLSARVDKALPDLLATYRQLHAAPELSRQEAHTSALLAERLKKLGYDVHTGIGHYTVPDAKGYGLIAIFKNGPGPRVLVRTDMDALPVVEQTNLPYASTVKVKSGGNEVGVDHACGHDIHMTSFLGTAQLLMELKDRWQGTVMLVAQPAEELGQGAQAMLDDGLYQHFGQPDFALALHDDPEIEAGSVGYVSGFTMADTTSVDITVHGIGGHGSRPEAAKDPIVLSAQIINALQTIVSREVSPLDQAVVTVGSIQGGTKRNIIPSEVTLLLTVRTFKEDVRQKVLTSIQRIAHFTALAAGMPEDKLPQVTVRTDEHVPPLYNDPALTARLALAFKTELGDANVKEMLPMMAGEDFGAFSLDRKIPSVLYRLGASDPTALADSRKTGVPLPALHSPMFAPIPEPTIRTGVRTMTAAVLTLLKK